MSLCISLYDYICRVGTTFLHMRTFVPGTRLTCMQACMATTWPTSNKCACTQSICCGIIYMYASAMSLPDTKQATYRMPSDVAVMHDHSCMHTCYWADEVNSCAIHNVTLIALCPMDIDYYMSVLVQLSWFSTCCMWKAAKSCGTRSEHDWFMVLKWLISDWLLGQHPGWSLVIRDR